MSQTEDVRFGLGAALRIQVVFWGIVAPGASNGRHADAFAKPKVDDGDPGLFVGKNSETTTIVFYRLA